MLPRDSDEQDFFRRVNKKMLGDQYDDTMSAYFDKQQKAVSKSSKKHRWLVAVAIAASLSLVLWCIAAFSTNNLDVATSSGLLSLLESANTPLSTSSGSIFDPSRNMANFGANNLLQSAKDSYKAKDYKNAAIFLKALLREHNDQQQYRLYLASCYSQMEQYEEAITNLNTFLEQDNNPDLVYQAKYHLGINLVYSGKLNQAKEIFSSIADQGWKSKKTTINKLLEML